MNAILFFQQSRARNSKGGHYVISNIKIIDQVSLHQHSNCLSMQGMKENMCDRIKLQNLKSRIAKQK